MFEMRVNLAIMITKYWIPCCFRCFVPRGIPSMSLPRSSCPLLNKMLSYISQYIIMSFTLRGPSRNAMPEGLKTNRIFEYLKNGKNEPCKLTIIGFWFTIIVYVTTHSFKNVIVISNSVKYLIEVICMLLFFKFV